MSHLASNKPFDNWRAEATFGAVGSRNTGCTGVSMYLVVLVLPVDFEGRQEEGGVVMLV